MGDARPQLEVQLVKRCTYAMSLVARSTELDAPRWWSLKGPTNELGHDQLTITKPRFETARFHQQHLVAGRGKRLGDRRTVHTRADDAESRCQD
jgi:hypothetical protein